MAGLSLAMSQSTEVSGPIAIVPSESLPRRPDVLMSGLDQPAEFQGLVSLEVLGSVLAIV